MYAPTLIKKEYNFSTAESTLLAVLLFTNLNIPSKIPILILLPVYI